MNYSSLNLLFYNPYPLTQVGISGLFFSIFLNSYSMIVIFVFKAVSASFYPPVSHDIKQQLRAHLGSITKNLPEDLQYVLKNS